MLVARTCVLIYFNVVENKSSRLGMVDYQITKINGFFKRGREIGARQAQGQASEDK
jgi:hypothetical protein